MLSLKNQIPLDRFPGPTGAQGPPGNTGPPGAPGISFVWENAWDSSILYNTNDVVFFQGSSWIAVMQNINDPPAITSMNWNLMAKKGEDLSGDIESARLNIFPQSPISPNTGAQIYNITLPNTTEVINITDSDLLNPSQAFNNSTTITTTPSTFSITEPGIYRVSFDTGIGSTIQNATVIAQIIALSDPIFSGIPLCSASISNFSTGGPDPDFPFIGSISSTTLFEVVNVPTTQYALKLLFVDPADYCVYLTSNISLNKIGSTNSSGSSSSSVARFSIESTPPFLFQYNVTTVNPNQTVPLPLVEVLSISAGSADPFNESNGDITISGTDLVIQPGIYRVSFTANILQQSGPPSRVFLSFVEQSNLFTITSCRDDSALSSMALSSSSNFRISSPTTFNLNLTVVSPQTIDIGQAFFDLSIEKISSSSIPPQPSNPFSAFRFPATLSPSSSGPNNYQSITTPLTNIEFNTSPVFTVDYDINTAPFLSWTNQSTLRFLESGVYRISLQINLWSNESSSTMSFIVQNAANSPFSTECVLFSTYNGEGTQLFVPISSPWNRMYSLTGSNTVNMFQNSELNFILAYNHTAEIFAVYSFLTVERLN